MAVTSSDGSSSTARRGATAASTRGAHAAEPSLGELVKDASESVSTIVRGEIALAKIELKSSVKNAGVGAGAFAAAATMLFFAAIFGLLALAEGIIAAGLHRWAGYLIVFGLLVVVAGLAAMIGLKKVKKVKAPQRTIETGKDTVAYLKTHPRGGGHVVLEPPSR